MLWCNSNKGVEPVDAETAFNITTRTVFQCLAVYGIPCKYDAVEETLWRMTARLLVKIWPFTDHRLKLSLYLKIQNHRRHQEDNCHQAQEKNGWPALGSILW